MKASILGGDGNLLCQIPSLRRGFEALGHTHTLEVHDSDTEFVFVGNPPFHDYTELIKEKKVIFNVLDICFHCKELDQIIESFKTYLPLASKVTTISKTVQKQLRDVCGIESDVIYYPMKDIKKTGIIKYPQFKVLIACRAQDANKRVRIAISALIKAGYSEDQVAIVGGEPVLWGTYIGCVSDEVLNDLYNSVDYVFLTSKNEGIGLSVCEAACAGAIPIVLPDLSTFDEFWANSPLGLNYEALTSIDKIVELIIELDNRPDWKQEVKNDMYVYGTCNLAPKFDKIEVAKRVIEVYKSI